ncbi:hypothetical protein [Streptomyces xinghaiensis]|uniref:rhamnogalacturonan lyase family protein n=1 Tax=Streptomyces xinghaiensis TaxID=1038928 RepID=UPI003427595E
MNSSPVTDSTNSSQHDHRRPRTRRHPAHPLLHDAQYRAALAWQHTACNQPPHAGLFIGAGTAVPPRPEVTAP